jgi:hypothetical protein
MNGIGLRYGYQQLLNDEENEPEVLKILGQLLDDDIVYVGKSKHVLGLLDRLKELGEDRIYDAAYKASEWVLKMY